MHADEAEAFAAQSGFLYFETSALTGVHVRRSPSDSPRIRFNARDSHETSLPQPPPAPATSNLRVPWWALGPGQVRDAFYLLACTVMNRLLEADPKNLINDGRGGVSLAHADAPKPSGCCLAG